MILMTTDFIVIMIYKQVNNKLITYYYLLH